jgi:ubiquinone biosynthesis protein
MSPGKHAAAVQKQPQPDPKKQEFPRRQPNSGAITKSERYREILAVLARHGIGVVDDQFIKHEAGDRARAEHLRLACEELGTMFIKLGQMLSTRSDLLPEEYRTELAKNCRTRSPRCPRKLLQTLLKKTWADRPTSSSHSSM